MAYVWVHAVGGFRVLAIRLAKIGCVAAVAFYVALVAFNNITDYWTNFAFVAHVLDMDQTFPQSDIRWRAITSPVIHHAGYVLIITVEIVTAALCAIGAVAMARQLRAKAQPFQQSKSFAIIGLTLGFLLYEGGFIAVGGEWFGMWQSQSWDGVPSAFRFVVTMLGVLIFVSLKDEDEREDSA
jgi:predicted small integral membrane protein